MTVAVATRLFVASDRRVDQDGAASSLVKVARNPHLVATAAGLASCVVRIRRAIRDGACDPHELVSLVDRASVALVVTASGDIWRIEEGLLWAERGIVTIGSGGDLAAGYLERARGRKALPTPDDARKAIRWVSKRRTDCGGGVDVRKVG